MAVIGVCANALVGFGLRSITPRRPFLMILLFLIALAFALIDDIDTPRHGLITVVPQNLVSLLNSLKTL